MENQTVFTVSPEELSAFKKARQVIIEKSVATILTGDEFYSIFGEKSQEILSSGLRFTAQTLEAIMTVAKPDMISQQLAWGNEYLPGMGIPQKMVLRNFEIFAESMQEVLPRETYPALAVWMQMVVDKQRDLVGIPQ